jgi:hypothetical protein
MQILWKYGGLSFHLHPNECTSHPGMKWPFRARYMLKIVAKLGERPI